MKIFEIVPTLDSGGAERFVVDICNELSKTADVTLVTLHSIETRGFYKNEISDRIRIISLNQKRRLDIKCLLNLNALILREKPDVIHTHLRAFEYLSFSMLLFRKIKYFHTVHSDAFKESGTKLSFCLKKFIFKNDLCEPVTISNISQESFYRAYSLPSSLIYNGRCTSTYSISSSVYNEIQLYRKTNKTRILLNVARIVSLKNQIMMCEIVKELVDADFDVVLLIIGKKETVEIVSAIENLKCENIYLLGEKMNPREYMSLVDAFCLSSEYEGMPISLIEAFSVGLVPICTPVGGIVDMIENGKNGFLSSDLSSFSYRDVVRKFLLMTQDEINTIKQNSLLSFNNFTIEDCANKYLSIFSVSSI